MTHVNRAGQTAALPLEVWLYVLPFAAAMVALEEARKLLRRAASD